MIFLVKYRKATNIKENQCRIHKLNYSWVRKLRPSVIYDRWARYLKKNQNPYIFSMCRGERKNHIQVIQSPSSFAISGYVKKTITNSQVWFWLTEQWRMRGRDESIWTGSEFNWQEQSFQCYVCTWKERGPQHWMCGFFKEKNQSMFTPGGQVRSGSNVRL